MPAQKEMAQGKKGTTKPKDLSSNQTPFNETFCNNFINFHEKNFFDPIIGRKKIFFGKKNFFMKKKFFGKKNFFHEKKIFW